MSTTNPQHGGPPADPVGGLAPIAPGTRLADDHGASGPPPAETIARGHEIDAYDTNSVLSVPLLVVLFFVLAFGTVSVIFYFIFPSSDDPNAHPMAVDRNKREITERYQDVPNPPLENFRQLEGHPRSITSPEKPAGNSPWIHPEDIRVNPTNTPSLYKTGWTDASKTHARLSIDDAMELAIHNDAINKKVLRTNQSPVPPRGSDHVPTASNAGRGAEKSQASPPQVPPAPPEDKKAPENKKPPGGKQ